jgi:N6-adenosine-specific RNA methylase IME4
MTIEAISNLPVSDLAARDSHLYLWAVNAYLTDAYTVAREWGFTPSTLLTWCKPPMGLGLGGTFVNTTEFVVFARRGSLPAKVRQPSTWMQWSRPYIGAGGPTHSAKPEAFLDLVEATSPGPYLEMFARRQRLGWDTWGNEALEHVSLAAVRQEKP